MKQFAIKTIATIGAMSIVLLATTGVAYAVGNTTDNGQGGSTTSGSDNSSSKKLVDAKLEACNNREAKIVGTMSRIANRATKRLALFDQITEKVKNLYTEKNLSVENYAALNAKITTARTAAQVSVQTEHANAAQFSCNSDDPKGSVAAFKNQQKTELAAMKDYRTAIKEFVTSIKASLISVDGE